MGTGSVGPILGLLGWSRTGVQAVQARGRVAALAAVSGPAVGLVVVDRSLFDLFTYQFRCLLRLQFQLNVRTIHPDFVGAHPLRRRRAEHLAAADLELGAMPGASDLVAFELPL